MKKRMTALLTTLLLALALCVPAMAAVEYGAIYDETEELGSVELTYQGEQTLPQLTEALGIDLRVDVFTDEGVEDGSVSDIAVYVYENNLVLALETGRPCEDRVIGNQFERLKKSANLPNVVFHSLRHSSTTYKLKLNHGDIKATQGDTGHAQASMVTEVYAHILDPPTQGLFGTIIPDNLTSFKRKEAEADFLLFL